MILTGAERVCRFPRAVSERETSRPRRDRPRTRQPDTHRRERAGGIRLREDGLDAVSATHPVDGSMLFLTRNIINFTQTIRVQYVALSASAQSIVSFRSASQSCRESEASGVPAWNRTATAEGSEDPGEAVTL